MNLILVCILVGVFLGIVCVCLKLQKMESKKIPENLDYDAISGLATEARLKLKDVRPLSIAQASRISGVNPADISILLVYIEQGKIAKISTN